TAKDVAEITRLLDESSFDELTLEVEGMKLTARRSGATALAVPTALRVPTAPEPGEPAEPAGPAPAVSPQESSKSTPTREIIAPLLGTFYRAPKPGAAPFVELGSAVVEDTISGIIDAMKLTNTVRAGIRARLAAIRVQYG